MSGQVAAESVSTEDRAERRQWGRFVIDVGKLVVSVTPTDQRNAKVLDESFGGIGILLDNATKLQPGFELNLIYEGVPMRGTVRSVRPDDDGRYRIGIEWQPSQAHCREGSDESAQIRGRLRILFRMWEAGRWNELARAVACLEREAQLLHLEPVVRHAAALRMVLAEAPPPTATPQPLVALVDACLNAEPSAGLVG